jgi:hypothetical protein
VLTNIDRLVDFHIYANEAQLNPLLEKASAEEGRPITTSTAILDMAGFSAMTSTSATRAYVLRMVALDSKHYPETLGRMFIINAPTVFSIAWSIIRPFLDERTQNKIEIFASEDGWKKRLREIIDVDKLPQEYGGSRVETVFPPSRTKKVAINAGKTFSDSTDAIPAGASVTFKWFCRPGDIVWSVLFHAAAGGAPKVVAEPKDFPTSDSKQVVLTLTEAAAGRYECVWSNSKGWWARDLFHRHDITVAGKPVGVR